MAIPPKLTSWFRLWLLQTHVFRLLKLSNFSSYYEFFSETVERKRQYCSETMEGKRLQSWNEAEVMLQIAKRAVEGLN